MIMLILIAVCCFVAGITAAVLLGFGYLKRADHDVYSRLSEEGSKMFKAGFDAGVDHVLDCYRNSKNMKFVYLLENHGKTPE